MFDPVTDDTLTGALDDFETVLNGMMSCQNARLTSIMQNYNVVLNGSLLNREAALPGATDVFPYTEYLTLRGAFIIAAQELLLTLRRAIEPECGIALGCSDADVSDIKSAGNLSNDLILSTIVETAMRKAVETSASVAFDHDVEIAVCQSLGDVAESLCMDGNISELTSVLILRVVENLLIGGEIASLSLRKDSGRPAGDIPLSADTNLTLFKSVVPQNAELFLDGELEVQSVRYRKLGDLEELTFADVADWTLYDFYYKEE